MIKPEDILLTYEEMKTINSNMPTTAKYGEVFVEIRNQEARRMWEFCRPYVRGGLNTEDFNALDGMLG